MWRPLHLTSTLPCFKYIYAGHMTTLSRTTLHLSCPIKSVGTWFLFKCQDHWIQLVEIYIILLPLFLLLSPMLYLSPALNNHEIIFHTMSTTAVERVSFSYLPWFDVKPKTLQHGWPINPSMGHRGWNQIGVLKPGCSSLGRWVCVTRLEGTGHYRTRAEWLVQNGLALS